MRIVDLKPSTLRKQCLQDFIHEDGLSSIHLPNQTTYIIPRPKLKYTRNIAVMSLAWHYRYNISNKYKDKPYEYIWELGEYDSPFNPKSIKIGETGEIRKSLMYKFSELVWTLRFKTAEKSTFGKPLILFFCEQRWLFEKHGGMLYAIKLNAPFRYMTKFLEIEEIKKDVNNLKPLLSEILDISLTYLKNGYYDDFLHEEYNPEYCPDFLSKESENFEYLRDLTKTEIYNTYKKCMSVDFNTFEYSKDFVENLFDTEGLHPELNNLL